MRQKNKQPETITNNVLQENKVHMYSPQGKHLYIFFLFLLEHDKDDRILFPKCHMSKIEGKQSVSLNYFLIFLFVK